MSVVRKPVSHSCRSALFRSIRLRDIAPGAASKLIANKARANSYLLDREISSSSRNLKYQPAYQVVAGSKMEGRPTLGSCAVTCFKAAGSASISSRGPRRRRRRAISVLSARERWILTAASGDAAVARMSPEKPRVAEGVRVQTLRPGRRQNHRCRLARFLTASIAWTTLRSAMSASRSLPVAQRSKGSCGPGLLRA